MENPDVSAPKKIIGYLAGEVASDRLMAALDSAAGMLTHINYAFGLIGPDGRAVLGDPDADIARVYPGQEAGTDGLQGNFRQLQLLKQRHPHLRTLISMGGWTGSGGFSDAAATEGGRRTLAASCIELFLTRWPDVFDGIDIDWEYPVHGGLPDNGYRPEDRHNCTLLFEELRRQLDLLGAATGQRYLLTAALPAGKELPMSTFEVREIAAILDLVNVMTYDISGSATIGVTNFNAALHPSSTHPGKSEEHGYQNVERTVAAFLEAGVPREKLIVGMPFYGRGFTGVPETNNGLYQPFSGIMSARYHEIVSDYLPIYRRHWHDEAAVPWLYDAERQTMVSYDDPESLRFKANFINDQALGGAMFWELSGDDAEWSLLNALSSRLRT